MMSSDSPSFTYTNVSEDKGIGEHSQVVSNQDINIFLDEKHAQAGKIIELNDKTKFYATGNEVNAKYGLVVIPDTMGWNSGRIRNIGDYFGANGFFVVIPKLSSSPTDSEGKGPNFFQSSSLGDYVKGITFEQNIKPKICSVLDHMKGRNYEKIVLLGFSWGGWIVANILASSDLAEHFVCGVIPHPSINLEERMYGGSMIELFSRIQRPLLLFPAKDDPKEYQCLIKLLAYKYPTSECVNSYTHLDHNFLLRGNVDHATVHDACVDMLEQTLYYFQYHCVLEEEEYIYPAEPKKLFIELSRVADMTAKEGAQKSQDMGYSSTDVHREERPQEEHEGMGRKMKHWMNKTGETFKHMGEKMKRAFTPVSSSTSSESARGSDYDRTGTGTATSTTTGSGHEKGTGGGLFDSRTTTSTTTSDPYQSHTTTTSTAI